MKKINCFIGLIAALVFLSATVQAANINDVNKPIINSSSTTATNLNFGTTTNGIWPSYIPASTSFTNITRIDVSGGKDLAIEFNCSSSQQSASNIVFQIGRSVSGGIPTNAIGTGTKIEWFATATNTLPNVANQISTSVYLYGPPQAAGSNYGEGACTAFYIGYVTVPALTTLTNYSVYVRSQ